MDEKLQKENEVNQKNGVKSPKKKDKNTDRNFSVTEVILLVILAILVGFLLGSFRPGKVKVVTTTVADKNYTDNEYLNEFIKNYEYILENYYEEVDQKELIHSAISGMMESLDDPYSMYIDEDSSNVFNVTLNGSYEGVGIQITKDEETKYILITGVFKDSPASEAGLQAGDYITTLDGKDVSEMDASAFSSAVREGSSDTHALGILRNGQKLEVTLSRRIVTINSVTTEIYNINNKKVGYMYVGIFANNTFGQFFLKLNELESEGIDYLIIDVRGNTGGHLTAVEGMLNLFLGDGQIMFQFDQNGVKTPVYGSGKPSKDYKIILMGDESSASASEVLIAGLKENLDCVFIGKKTYGKGTVQELVTMPDGGQYKLTVKKWLTPKGNWVNDTEGIIPDIEVDLDVKYLETGSQDDDSQLQAAFKYIKEH